MGPILVLQRWCRLLCSALATIGCLVLLAMMFLIAFDVMGRDLFNVPILGTFEIVEYLMVPTVFLALGYAQFEDAHISVDIAVRFLSAHARAALAVLTLLLTLAVFVPMAWVSYRQAVQVYDQQLVSTVLLIPRWPFQVVALIGVVAFSLAVVVDLILAVARGAGSGIEGREIKTAKPAAD